MWRLARMGWAATQPPSEHEALVVKRTTFAGYQYRERATKELIETGVYAIHITHIYELYV